MRLDLANQLRESGISCSQSWSSSYMFSTLIKENNLSKLLHHLSPSINSDEASEIICTLFFSPTTPLIVDPLGHFGNLEI